MILARGRQVEGCLLGFQLLMWREYQVFKGIYWRLCGGHSLPSKVTLRVSEQPGRNTEP